MRTNSGKQTIAYTVAVLCDNILTRLKDLNAFNFYYQNNILKTCSIFSFLLYYEHISSVNSADLWIAIGNITKIGDWLEHFRGASASFQNQIAQFFLFWSYRLFNCKCMNCGSCCPLHGRLFLVPNCIPHSINTHFSYFCKCLIKLFVYLRLKITNCGLLRTCLCNTWNNFRGPKVGQNPFELSEKVFNKMVFNCLCSNCP